MGTRLKSWLLTTDHKRIALLYLISVSIFFFLGGFFAMLIRLELLTPEGDLMQADTYNKVFTIARHDHGVFLSDPGRARDARQLPGAAHDRRQGSRIPAHQPAELVSLHHRPACSSCTAC